MRKVSKAVYKFRRGHQRTLTKSQRSPLKRSNAVIIEIASHAKKKKERKKTTHTQKKKTRSTLTYTSLRVPTRVV